MNSNLTRKLVQLTCTVAAAAGCLGPAQAEGLDFISPVTNPLFFEDANVATEVRPIFAQHYIPKSFITGGGEARVYAAQLRYAVTERLAIIATKDGFIEFHPKAAVPHNDGWADLAAGLKYALIRDEANRFLLTPGIKLELPTGNQRVFQGSGSGVWDLFVSSAKAWGRYEVQGNLGVTVPNDFDKKTSLAHYSLQLSYDVCRWFKPFVSANGFTVLSDGKGLPLDSEGFDLINFGSSDAKGQTQLALGGGFRTEITPKCHFGIAGEAGVGQPKGLFESRITADVSYRF